jgi:hypothetical protein
VQTSTVVPQMYSQWIPVLSTLLFTPFFSIPAVFEPSIQWHDLPCMQWYAAAGFYFQFTLMHQYWLVD